MPGIRTDRLDPIVMIAIVDASLISVILGAVVASAGGLVGAVIQARREHAKWLRDKLYEAFVDLRRILFDLDHVDHEQELAGITGDVASIQEQVRRRAVLEGQLRASIAALFIAPPEVEKAAGWYGLQRNQTYDPKKRADAERQLMMAMRRALKIRG